MYPTPRYSGVSSFEMAAFGSVAVVEHDGYRRIKLNNYYVLGGSHAAGDERLQGQIPLLLHPRPERVAFLGLGVATDLPSWGRMVAHARGDLVHLWWMSTLPGLGIVVTVLAFNLLGDGLRDALDPRLAQSGVKIK